MPESSLSIEELEELRVKVMRELELGVNSDLGPWRKKKPKPVAPISGFYELRRPDGTTGYYATRETFMQAAEEQSREESPADHFRHLFPAPEAAQDSEENQHRNS